MEQNYATWKQLRGIGGFLFKTLYITACLGFVVWVAYSIGYNRGMSFEVKTLSTQESSTVEVDKVCTTKDGHMWKSSMNWVGNFEPASDIPADAKCIIFTTRQDGSVTASSF